MTSDRDQLERELTRHLAETAGAPRPDASVRVRARVAATPQRGAWLVRLGSALRSPGWARAGALAAVAAAALLVGIYIGQVGLPFEVGPSASPSAVGDGSPTPGEPWVEPAAYSFVLDSSCGERSLIGRFRVTVVGGTTRTFDDLTDPPSDRFEVEDIPTLGDLIEEVEAAGRDGADVARLESHPDDGHPVEIEIDWSTSAIDDEACYAVSEYVVRGQPSERPAPTEPTAMSFAAWHRLDMPDPAPGVFGGGTPSSVVAFNGGYLAVGTIFTECCAEGDPAANVGLVWASMYGSNWRLVDTGDTFVHATLHRVVVAGSRLLASGWYAEPGVERPVAATWVSDDGIAWQRIPDPAPSWVVVGDGLLLGAADVTIGPDRSVTFLRSGDGLTWTVTDVQPELSHVSAAIAAPGAGALFIGPVHGERKADGSPTLDVQAWMTPDGVTWTGSIAARNATFRGVAAWDGGFVAVGSQPGVQEGTAVDIGLVWTSPDGLAWEATGPGTGIEESTMTGVYRVGEALVAVAECCGGDAVLRPTAWVSEDGVNWTFVPHQPAFEGWEIQVHGVVETPDGLLAVGRRWDQESNHPVPQAWLASSVPMLWLEATSEPGAEIGTEYEFQFGHCGLQSPIDFDGSLWVLAGIDYVQPPVPLDMLEGTIRLTGPDSAVFEDSASNWTMGFDRHDGPLAYPLCD